MEKWKFLKDSDRYEISTHGKVRSVDYVDTFIGSGKVPCERKKKGRMLIISHNGKGYKKVGLANIGQKYIHRLVAETYLPNPEGKRTVNHLDGNKSNNRLDNLEWATHSENQFHSKATGLAKKGGEHKQSKLSNEDVEFIRKNYIPRHPEFGCNAMGRKYGISGGHINNILKYKSRVQG